ncbi:MAG: SDR family NAD(P)-dependent oxidoreductase [Clostridia bacterium]|nr:SDR family NAD(P)-dependent oxidoreductase [Clostridia bacterium]MBQ9795324.1 SDR family NAD(P)-dependent oxidoreductase [Clostridia bacterium]
MIRTKTFLHACTSSLGGKTVAITGSTGGIGGELCRYLAVLGASLILLDRNEERSHAHRERLMGEYPGVTVECIPLDLEDIRSVKRACECLHTRTLDVFIHNAGAYSIPRHKTSCGYDNVFQINFASPYYMIDSLLPQLRERGGRVIAVGSIAHRYSHIDPHDVDFSARSTSSKVYGNAKRYLMFGLWERFRGEEGAELVIAHPGITLTGITAHYPKVIFALIKHPMRVIFMKPRRACLAILWGLFEDCGYGTWLGPGLFDVWGLPRKKRLGGCPSAEREEIGRLAARVLKQCKECAQ